MKKTNLIKVVAVSALMLTSSQANAQFLKKLAKAATTTVADNSSSSTTAADSTKKIDWSKIPVYTLQRVNEVDAKGNQVTNADGTESYYVFLIDQFGNRRSESTVEAQIKKINQAVGNILLNVGGGAALGAISGLVSGGGSGAAVGAGVGAATGVLASLDDIKMAKKQKKSLKQQEKLLATYKKNFTEEGRPINAKVDTSKLDGFDIKAENTLSMNANEIKEASKNMNVDDSAWEI